MSQASPRVVDMRHAVARCAAFGLKLPIHIYRYTLKALVGWHCRHLPTCSEYALEAIDRNGAWRGLWLTVSRLWRCRPGGTSGYDPVPDIEADRHRLAPWRYGRWRTVTPAAPLGPADGDRQSARATLTPKAPDRPCGHGDLR